jgi:neutral ceramidase
MMHDKTRGVKAEMIRASKAMKLNVLLLAPLLTGALCGADFKAGFGRRQITPPMPFWLAGFDSRTHAAESVAHDVWTKALAIEDAKGQKLVVITADLATMPLEMFDTVAARVMRHHRLDRSHVLINISHTHSGPALHVPSGADRAMLHRMEGYRATLMDSMVAAADDAVAGLQPVRISYGTGQVGFSHNRRERVPGGGWRFGMDPNGPVDRTVPVLRVFGMDGRLRGVLFGLACHPSALTYEFYVVSGDYAGIAQAAVEQAHPGATALFLQLCGGDQTTYPRRKMELAEKYGRELGAEVDRVLQTPMKPVRSPLKIAMLTTELPYAAFSIEQFEQQAKDKDNLVRKHAERLLKRYAAGEPPWASLPYTMQAIRFGRGLTLLAMNGEVVVDYDLRVKREYGADDMIVAGYSNARQCYIPSLRLLKEGGYEPHDSILMESFPGPFSDQVEEVIFSGIHELMQAVGRTPAR